MQIFGPKLSQKWQNFCIFTNVGLFYTFFTCFWVMLTYEVVMVPAASHGCQNMTKEAVLVIFWSILCNQYRGLPRQILLFIWSKNMFFRLVSASLGQIWTILRRVFRRPVNVALKEGWWAPTWTYLDLHGICSLYKTYSHLTWHLFSLNLLTTHTVYTFNAS